MVKITKQTPFVFNNGCSGKPGAAKKILLINIWLADNHFYEALRNLRGTFTGAEIFTLVRSDDVPLVRQELKPGQIFSYESGTGFLRKFIRAVQLVGQFRKLKFDVVVIRNTKLQELFLARLSKPKTSPIILFDQEDHQPALPLTGGEAITLFLKRLFLIAIKLVKLLMESIILFFTYFFLVGSVFFIFIKRSFYTARFRAKDIP